MTDRFLQKKRAALAKYRKARSEGAVDDALVGFLDDLNDHPDFYTTSSCSGRIVLLSDVGSKLHDDWLGKWHRTVTAKEILDALEPVEGVTWLIQESFILHLHCRTRMQAKQVIDLAIASGFKRTGLIAFDSDRWAVEVLSTERIAAPVQRDGVRLVDEPYIEFLVELANERFSRAMEKTNRFISSFNKTVNDAKEHDI